jgi:hypothetical protein
VELEAVPAGIGRVRRIVTAQLRYWHLAALIDDTSLGVSELLTNVLQHAEPDKRCTVELAVLPGQLHISVRDHDSRLPRLEPSRPLESGVHGLSMLAALSDSWGARRMPGGGKDVWFTLAAPGPGPAPGLTPWR